MKWLSAFIIMVLWAALAAPLPAASAEGREYSIVFYSGRGDNKDIHILIPGMKEPRNLSCHPAWDGWASFISSRDGGQRAPAPSGGIAIVTFVSTPEQERAVNALIRSIRELSGSYRTCPIHVVTADPVNLSCRSLQQAGAEVLPLEMESVFQDYPLALKAFAAAQVEARVKENAGTLVWLDPGVLVLGSLADLDLEAMADAAVRPVTLANTIGIPPRSEANDYWKPIYEETGLDPMKLPALTTIADEVQIQPYYNCEVFSFNPKLGLAQEWARLLTRFLKDEKYQKTVCTTFLRKLFLHQAVLSAVISAKVKPERIKVLPLTSGYPFSQHARLPGAKKAVSMNDLSAVIFDRTWLQDPAWMGKMRIAEPMKGWLENVYREFRAAAGE